MEVRIDSLMSYEEFLENPTTAVDKVECLGEVIIIKDNELAYRITKIESEKIRGSVDTNSATRNENNQEMTNGNIHHVGTTGVGQRSLTLREAVIEVLNRYNGGPIHVSEIADILYDEKLYLKRDGGKAHYTQVRAMCGYYSDDFLTMPGNKVKLR